MCLEFCPLNIIELIPLSENEQYKRVLQNCLQLFLRSMSYALRRDKFHASMPNEIRELRSRLTREVNL
jgi:hypothetical protein